MKTLLLIAIIFLFSFNSFALITCHGNVLDRATLFVIDKDPIDLTMKIDGEPMQSESNPEAIKFFNDNDFIYIFDTPNGMVFAYKFDLLNNQVEIGRIKDGNIKKISDVNLSEETDIKNIKLDVLETATINCI